MNSRIWFAAVMVLGVGAACSDDEESKGGNGGDAGAGGRSGAGGSAAGGSAAGGRATGGGPASGGSASGGAPGSGGSDAGPVEAGTVSYSGLVVVAVPGSLGSESGLAGASVCVVDATGAPVAAIPCVTTNASGEYSLTGLAPGEDLIVRYSADGYVAQLAAVDVGTADIARTPLRLGRAAADGGADAGPAQSFGWDPALVIDPAMGSMNVFAVMAAASDGGTMGLGVDFTTGVSFTITPSGGSGPYYINPDETWAASATATAGGWGAWVMNLPPRTYTVTATHATMTCTAIASAGFGWAQTDGSQQAPVLAGLNTQSIGFFCAAPVTDAGTD